MTPPDSEHELDDVLVCEFAKRPRGAPTLFDVLPSVRGQERRSITLDVVFDPDAAPAVAA